jgi:hypothetical protein
VRSRSKRLSSPRFRQTLSSRRIMKLTRNPRSGWGDVIASVASDYVLGFDITGDADSQASFDQMNDKLDGIQNSINTLNGKIDTVIQMLQELPSIITGIVDAAFARQWVTQAQSIVGHIRQNTYKYQDYEANKRAVQSEVLDLDTAIDEVWDNLGSGWTAASVTSGAVAAWAQFESMILSDSELYPAPPPITKVDFVKRLQARFMELAVNTAQVKRAATDLVTNTPDGSVYNPDPYKNNWTFDTRQDRFKLFNSWDGSTQIYYARELFYPHPPRIALWASVKAPQGFAIADNASPEPGWWMDSPNVVAASASFPGLASQLPDAQNRLVILANSGLALQGIGRALGIPTLRKMSIPAWQNFIRKK